MSTGAFGTCPTITVVLEEGYELESGGTDFSSRLFKEDFGIHEGVVLTGRRQCPGAVGTGPDAARWWRKH